MKITVSNLVCVYLWMKSTFNFSQGGTSTRLDLPFTNRYNSPVVVVLDLVVTSVVVNRLETSQ